MVTGLNVTNFTELYPFVLIICNMTTWFLAEKYFNY